MGGLERRQRGCDIRRLSLRPTLPRAHRPTFRPAFLHDSMKTPALYLLLVLVALPALAQDPPSGLTTGEDHALMMDALGIDSLRRGANGMNPEDPFYANYDEALANPYPSLPRLMLTNDRRPVTTPDLWWSVRRPELVELFEREIYGRIPDDVPDVTWEVTGSRDSLLSDVPVTIQVLRGWVDNAGYQATEVSMRAELVLPRESGGPVPVIIQFGWIGPFPWRRPGQDGPTGPTWKDLVVERGWGYAVLVPNSVQADNGAGLTRGVIGLTNRGEPRAPDAWGALRAWAWGASRLLDYFETEPRVDAARVGIEGHSRYGKAAAVTLAFDERFATAFVSSSGEGGLKLHRRNYGEIVENLTGSGEYHWMAGNFLKYGGPLTWDDLPVDAHELVALCAPRPIFISSGDVGDYWVDARGMFLAGAHAAPAYELLGARGMGTMEFPPLETGLLDGEIAFRQHAAGHTDGPNWPVFLEFAARYFEDGK